jgi:hypothetical protein
MRASSLVLHAAKGCLKESITNDCLEQSPQQSELILKLFQLDLERDFTFSPYVQQREDRATGTASSYNPD